MGGTPPTPVSELSLLCPASLQITAPAGSAVTFSAPTPNGGVAPYTVTCAPASGTAFASGTTLVTCHATDAAARPAACNFAVTLTPAIPVLAVTSFVAFGDSITAGEVQTNVLPTDIELQNAYPTVLQNMLAARYTSQTMVVVNKGTPCQPVADASLGCSGDSGSATLPGVLAAERPQALLLLQGIIDLSAAQNGAIPGLITGLGSMIDAANAQGVAVFLGTLLPEKPHLPGFPDNTFAICCIDNANASIRSLAASKGVTLVDLNAAFKGNEAILIGGDGLHPTVLGYQTMATRFFNAIKAKFEIAGNAQKAGSREAGKAGR